MVGGPCEGASSKPHSFENDRKKEKNMIGCNGMLYFKDCIQKLQDVAISHLLMILNTSFHSSSFYVHALLKLL